jgi:hypothetical protein
MFAIHIIQMQEPERLESKCGITVQLMESQPVVEKIMEKTFREN